ncbi:MAG: hypothetical protein HYV63_02175, partial [Candidatus Schekmanbacteria bacterium]|nr:hypothetical protein [Candidatus Schekmanbacteria bacterium]
YAHDELGRLTAMTTRNPSVVPELSYTYTYDAEGQVLRITDGLGEHVYTYDAAGRLTGADHPDGGPLVDEWYAYDALGRRTASHLSGTYEYDAAGRLVADEHRAYESAPGGELERLVSSAENLEIAFFYEASGLLSGWEETRASDATLLASWRYEHDPEGRRAVDENTLAGQLTHRWSDGENLVWVEGEGASQERYVYAEGIDEVLGGEIAGDKQELARNQRNDVVGILTTSGASRMRSYDSFGVLPVPAEDDGSVDRFTFAARERIPVTSAVHYDVRARVLDVEVGRYWQPDRGGQLAGRAFEFRVNDPLRLSPLWNPFKPGRVIVNDGCQCSEYGIYVKPECGNNLIHHDWPGRTVYNADGVYFCGHKEKKVLKVPDQGEANITCKFGQVHVECWHGIVGILKPCVWVDPDEIGWPKCPS